MALGSRVKEIREQKGISQAQLAEKVGISQTAIHLLEQRDSRSSKFLVEIANALGISPSWLSQGHEGITFSEEQTPTDDDYVLIPQYDASAACGKGQLNDYVTVKGGLAFRRDWIRSMGWQTPNLYVLYAVKDSMSPTINNGAIVLVNTLETQPRSGSLYLISWYGEERIKRVFKDGNTVYRFSSDNPNKAQFPDERVDLSESADVSILGRVVWQAGVL